MIHISTRLISFHFSQCDGRLEKKSNNKTKKTLIYFPSVWEVECDFFFKGGSTPLLHKGLILCLLSMALNEKQTEHKC